MRKLTTVAMQRPPSLPDGAPDRLTLSFDDDSQLTHVFGSYFSNRSDFQFMLELYRRLKLEQ